MTVVVDASVVVSALVVSRSDGAWAEDVLSRGSLNAPHVMPVEVAAVLRRSAAAGSMSEHMATQAHHDIGRLRVALFPYEVTADRVWELRHWVSPMTPGMWPWRKRSMRPWPASTAGWPTPTGLVANS